MPKFSINTTKNYSLNFDQKKRKSKKIKFLIFHYTGMKNENSAINKLLNKNSKVSCHYFIKKNGQILNLVPDLYIAWHAGVSSWKNYKFLNKNSIGIEINNPGHNFIYKKFSIKQINSLIKLSIFLIKKFKIKNSYILGHSDIAPDRKKDPGEKFPWKLMKKKNMSIWHDLNEVMLKSLRNQKCNNFELFKFFNNLKKIGYQAKSKIKAAKAFQRRFRQEQISGKIDKECLLISNSLIKLNKY